MSSGYRYFTGDYLKYYNELGSNAGLSSKANSFRSSVEIISRDFEMIKSVMNTWSGEGASAMSIEAISSIMNKFNMTKENINSSLIPATEAMEKLVENLKLMKEKEETLIKTEELLSIERAKDIPSTIYDGKDKKGNDIYKHNPAYDSWIDNIKRLEEEVNLLIKELEQLKQLCDESIELVKMFESQIREFSDFIGIANSVIGINGESGDFASMSFEERIAFLNNILVEYGKVKEKLDAFYMEKYGRGFSLSNEDFENIFMLFDAFDLFYKSGTSVSEFKNLPTEGGNVLLKIDALIKVMSYCEYTGAIDKITNYLNGESWEESGLAELYEQDGIFGYNEKRFNQRMRTFYGINNPKEYLKNKLDNILGSWNNLEKAYGEFQVTRQAIGIMNQKIDNLETAMKLLPYEIHIEDELFIEKYKGVKFGDIPGLDELFNKHMTDDEKALYKYLCDTKGVDYANEYLGLMKDPMNMREGMARAKEYVEWIGRDGFQVVDIANGGFEGFKDGVRNFFDGVGDLFRVADTQAGTKSALDYEMMFKAQYMLDAADSLGIDIDPNIRNMLNQAYQTGNTVGTMAVPMIAGAIPGVGQTLSTVLMTASFTGNAAVEGRQNGLDVGAAYLYGAISGGSEVVLERALGAVPFVGDLSGSLLKDTCSEMLEESIQTVFDAGLNYVFYGEETTGAELLGNVLESAKQAAISTPFMQGFGKVVGPTVGGASTIATNLITGNSYTIGEVYQLADNKVSSFFMNKADVAIHGGIDAIQSNGQVSFLDKVLLDKSINSVSAEELATITSNIPKSDVAQLVDSGLLSNRSVEKLRLADTVASISSQDAGSLDVSSLTKSDLSSEVTRNGKTLSEYIANTKADSITESTMNDLRQISAKEARVVETTMNDNAKAFARQERSTNIRSGIESSISTPTVESPTAFTAQESGVQVTENLPSTYAATSSTDNLQSSQRALETFTPSSEYSASYSETNGSMIADSLTPIINDGAISLSQYDTMEQTTTTEGSIPIVAKASSIGLAGGVAAMTMMNGIGTTNATVNTGNSAVVNGQTRKVGNAESLFANSSESSLSKDTTISTQTTQSSYNKETISSETTTTSMYGGLSSITPNYSTTDNSVLDFQSTQVESISDTVDSYFSTIKDMEYAINKMMEKYECSREKCYDQIRTLIKTGNFNYMTSNGNARTILQQYSLNQIQNALDSIIEMDSVTSKMKSDVEYSIEKYIERFKVDRKEALEALHRLVNEKAYNYMTSYGNARSILQQYSFKQIQTILSKIELSEGINQKIEPIILNNLDPNFSTSKFFEAHGNPENETYGVDQGTIYKMFEFQSRDGTAYSYREAMQIVENAKQERKPLPKFTKIGTLEYFELKNKVIEKYGLTDKEASILLTCIDNTGACSYASVCNEIFDYFKEKETSFEKTFGYPMYKTVDGNQVLNSEYLLLDLYMFANNIDNGGKFVYKDNNGRHHLNTSLLSEQVDPLGRRLLKTNMQMYMSSSSGKNKEIINKFLNSKGLRYETNILVDYGSKINTKKMDETIEHVIEGIKKGYNYSLGIYSRGQPINMRAPRGVSYGSASTSNWSEGGGHSVFVTGIDSSGFIVSSWGRKYIIPFSDLRNGGLWVLNEGKILEKGAYSDKLFNVSSWRNLGGIRAKETVGLKESAASMTTTNATSTVNEQLSNTSDISQYSKVTLPFSNTKININSLPYASSEEIANNNYIPNLVYDVNLRDTKVNGVLIRDINLSPIVDASYLTEKKINELNKYVSENPGVHIGVRLINTSGLTTETIKKLDSRIFFKIEGAFDTNFINDPTNNPLIFFDSNVFSRNEMYNIAKKMETIEAEIDPSWSELKKACYVYEVLKRKIKYNNYSFDNRAKDGYKANEISSLRGLIYGDCVCSGYAVIYKELMDRLGIECYYEYGNAHAWNIIKIDGKYYPCDVTKDSASYGKGMYNSNYQFTNLKKFLEEHTPEYSHFSNYDTMFSEFPRSLIETISAAFNYSSSSRIVAYNLKSDNYDAVVTQIGSLYSNVTNSIIYIYNYNSNGIVRTFYGNTDIGTIMNQNNSNVNIESLDKMFSEKNIARALSSKGSYLGGISGNDIVLNANIENELLVTKTLRNINNSELSIIKIGAESIANTSLNRYMIFDSTRQRSYVVLSETDIFNENHSESSIAKWLNSDRLNSKRSNYSGYIGYLQNGNIYGTKDVIDYFDRIEGINTHSSNNPLMVEQKLSEALSKNDVSSLKDIAINSSEQMLTKMINNLKPSEILSLFQILQQNNPTENSSLSIICKSLNNYFSLPNINIQYFIEHGCTDINPKNGLIKEIILNIHKAAIISALDGNIVAQNKFLFKKTPFEKKLFNNLDEQFIPKTVASISVKDLVFTNTISAKLLTPEIMNKINDYLRKYPSKHLVIKLECVKELNSTILDSFSDRVLFKIQGPFSDTFYSKSSLCDFYVNHYYSDIFTSQDLLKELPSLIRMESKLPYFEEFLYAFITGEESDFDLLKLYFSGFYNFYKQGNDDAFKMLQIITRLKKQNPSLKFKFVSEKIGGSCWSWHGYTTDKGEIIYERNTIYIDKEYFDWNVYGTSFHELGHCLFSHVLREKIPNDFNKIVEDLRIKLTAENRIYFSDFKLFQKQMEKVYYDAHIKAKKIVEEQLQKKGFKNIDAFIATESLNYENDIKAFEQWKNALVRKYPSLKKMIENLTPKEVLAKYVDHCINMNRERLCRLNGSISALSDITDSIFKGNECDLKGRKIFITYGHGCKYYKNNYERSAIHEMIADFTALKIAGKQDSLNSIRSVFGDNFYNMIDSIYQQFLQY